MTWALTMLLGLAHAQPTRNPEDCPAGHDRVPTNNRLEPFHCKPRGSSQPPVIEMTPNYKRLDCPKGFEPRATPGQKSRHRCVPSKRPDDPEPQLAPVLAPPVKEAGARAAAASPFSAPVDYLRYTIKDHIQLEYPRDWHVVNGWADEVPTLYIEFDTGRQGRQVALVVSRIARSQAGYEDAETAISREKEYQNAADAGKGRVGSFPARFTVVASASRTAYVLIGDGDYFTISYSAPDDLFKTFEPVYKRLLQSFRVAKRLQEGD